MKVMVTFEISDDQRLAIGALKQKQLNPATREEIQDYCREVVEAELLPMEQRMAVLYKTLVDGLTAG